MAARVLLVEDDPNLGLIIAEHLQLNGFEAKLCVDGVEGLAAFREGTFELCLLDVMMPKKDGFTLAGEIRELDRNVPMIFLTAKSLKEDKIKGFKAGCDDYITKPFSIEELLLRIEAVLRRSQPARTDEMTKFEFGCFKFDSVKRQLVGKSTKCKLTSRESELLRLLCLHPNETLMRADALKEIWGDENYFSGRSMDVFVSKLRKHLAEDDSVQIMNIHGQGFRLVVG